MQTILGAGGAIGHVLAQELTQYTDRVRLVSRNPVRVNPADELMPADLLDPEQMQQAVSGSSVVYITVGFPYRLKTWRAVWPRLMTNVLEACRSHGARIVFFDNIYMYDPAFLNGMTEETPVNPPSRKGAIRARIARQLMDAAEKGQVEALIARSADFYGPGIQKTSILTETVFAPLARGKKANWLGSLDYQHSFTYVPDAGKATALLGNTEDAYNQVWHLPTAGDPPTGREWVESIANALEVRPRCQVAGRFIVKVMGAFNPVMKELFEMMYQYDRDYIFNSKKFEQRFQLRPTSYADGIREIATADYGK
ncbi:MAG: NAD-dependent epimerase/dehydratase family protein [Saprospiraceae bacterium]|nr:NAD-dependent epimerase/dehydratase family protein [Saprospiraceae bacterium]